MQQALPILLGLAIMAAADFMQEMGFVGAGLTVIGPVSVVVGVAALARPDAFGREKEWATLTASQRAIQAASIASGFLAGLVYLWLLRSS